MNTIFMNSKNIKTSDPYRLLLNLIDKIDLRGKYKYIALSNLSIYHTWKNIKKLFKKNKFKISPPTWNEEFELPDGSYSISDVQDYFKYIFKKHEEKTVDPSIRICTNKIENRITIKIKTGYCLEFLTPETIKLLGSTKSNIKKDENGVLKDVRWKWWKMHHLEITEVVLIHCNVVSNSYQQNWRALYTFVPNKSFGQSLNISPKKFYIFKRLWLRVSI